MGKKKAPVKPSISKRAKPTTIVVDPRQDGHRAFYVVVEDINNVLLTCSAIRDTYNYCTFMAFKSPMLGLEFTPPVLTLTTEGSGSIGHTELPYAGPIDVMFEDRSDEWSYLLES